MRQIVDQPQQGRGLYPLSQVFGPGSAEEKPEVPVRDKGDESTGKEIGGFIRRRRCIRSYSLLPVEFNGRDNIPLNEQSLDMLYPARTNMKL
jgi:hypothetical protein